MTLPESDRKGPSWAWILQRGLEANLAPIVAAGAVVLVGALITTATYQAVWDLCSYWGHRVANQRLALSLMVLAVYTVGVGLGIRLEQAS